MNIPSHTWANNNIPLFLDLGEQRSIAVLDHEAISKSITFPLTLGSVVSGVCIKGSLSANVDLKKVVFPEHSLIVLRPGHTLSNYHATPDFQGIFIISTLKNLASTLPSFSRVLPCIIYFGENPVINLSDDELECHIQLLKLLRNKLHNQNPYQDKVLHALCEAIFYETLGIYTNHMNRANPATTSAKRKDELLLRFISLIEQHYKQERSVQFYAEKLCITAKHLSAAIKEASGRTAGEWIDSYVMLYAKLELSNSDKTIQEISMELNFANQSFFGKYFKNHTGISPRAYRENNQ